MFRPIFIGIKREDRPIAKEGERERERERDISSEEQPFESSHCVPAVH